MSSTSEQRASAAPAPAGRGGESSGASQPPAGTGAADSPPAVAGAACVPSWALPDAWITSFSTPTPAYVHAPLPPAGLMGHRAELWDLARSCVGAVTVALDVAASSSDAAAVHPARLRLTDVKSGALFAEAPIPAGVPVAAVVEPAIDSARYFAVRVVDPSTAKAAVVGVGWADRPPASALAAALADLETDRRRAARAAGGGRADGGEGDGPPPLPTPPSLALRPGETVHVPLVGRGGGVRPAAKAKLARAAAAAAALAKGGGGGGVLPPPPPPPAGRPPDTAGDDDDDGWGAFVG